MQNGSTVRSTRHAAWRVPLVWTLPIALGYFAVSWGNWALFKTAGVLPMPIWPAAGLAAAVAFRFGWAAIPGLWLGTFLANGLALGASWKLSALVGIMNAVGPVIAACGVKRFSSRPFALQSVRDVVSFLFWFVAFTALLTAIGGIGARFLLGTIPAAEMPLALFRWWVAHASGAVLFGPLFLAPLFPPPVPPPRTLEFTCVAAGTIILAVLTFLVPVQSFFPFQQGLPFLLIAPMAWVAIRHSLFNTMLLFTVVVILGMTGTALDVAHPFSARWPLLPFGLMSISYSIVLVMLSAIRSEENRAQHEMRLRDSALSSTVNAIMINAVDGRVLFVNESFLRTFGYTREESYRLRPIDLARDPDIFQEHWAPLQATGVFIGEGPLKRKDGSVFSAIITSSVVTNERGFPVATIGSFVDITERERAAAALRESEERLRLISDHIPGCLVYQLQLGESPDQRRFTFVSGAIESMHGLTADAVLSDAHLIYQQIDEADLPTFLEREARALAELVPFNAEARVHLPSGETRWRSLRSAPRQSSDGSVVWDGIEIDITERKRAEEERTLLQQQLQQSQKIESIGRLAGGVAHDFNNMLGVILGHTELALESIDRSHPAHVDLEAIMGAAQRSSQLTQQLLAFARRQTIAPRRLDLNEIVEDMLKMLRRLIGEDIHLAWRPGPDLGAVKMDPTQVGQILTNLCVNARDALEKGGQITIETHNASFDETYLADETGVIPGDFVQLAVSDNGRGMSLETQQKLFEPFFTTKELGQGTGLGLATVYGIVKQNAGFITVYSELGTGTTIKIYLPLYEATEELFQPCEPPRGELRGSETILLLEDEPAFRNITHIMLRNQGYTVLCAGKPSEAIHLAQEHTAEIHLLLTDVIMPEMNGRELADRILASHPNIKRLFMSGYTADVIAHHGVLDAGVHFLQKPFSRLDLATKVREVLGNRGDRAAGFFAST